MSDCLPIWQLICSKVKANIVFESKESKPQNCAIDIVLKKHRGIFSWRRYVGIGSAWLVNGWFRGSRFSTW
jgi:hypothetical protein